jgi:WS/DGAT/MGAT family acyltransferase
METPAWHQHIAGLVVVDPTDAPDFSYERVVQTLVDRLELAPKFLWKLKEVPLNLDRPVWIDDEAFDINQHLRRVAVPAPGDQHEVALLLGDIMASQLDRDRPLWEFWFIDGLANGYVACLLKAHHSLIDGVSGASLSTVLMDLEPNATEPLTPPPEDGGKAGREPSSWELLARSVIPTTSTPTKLARYGFEALNRGITALEWQYERGRDGLNLGGVPKTRWNAKIGPRRTCSFASVSIDDAKRLKDLHDVKINDVVLAICAGAMRSYLEGHGEMPDASLVAGVPISIRAEGDTELGTKISNMVVSLATDIDDPLERLLTINANSQASKEMTAAMRAKRIQSLGETAPPLMLNLVMRTMHDTGVLAAAPTVMNTVISNVPGPPFPLYFCGAPTTGMFPGSVIMETMGLNITVLSYVDRLDFGLSTDPELVPDVWTIADGIPVAMNELLAASGLGDPTPVVDAFGTTTAPPKPQRSQKAKAKSKPKTKKKKTSTTTTKKKAKPQAKAKASTKAGTKTKTKTKAKAKPTSNGKRA